MNLVLFGFKTCGKTHFGRLVATKLGYHFVDTDRLIEDLYATQEGERLTCRQIFLELGEDLFRHLEREAIGRIAHKKGMVIAVGGGAVLDHEVVEMLKKLGTLVYIHTDKETLLERITRHGAAYFDGTREHFTKIYDARHPVYEEIDAITVHTSGRNDDEVVARLQEVIRGE